MLITIGASDWQAFTSLVVRQVLERVVGSRTTTGYRGHSSRHLITLMQLQRDRGKTNGKRGMNYFAVFE
jgi:hypothetical protein